MVVCAVYGCNSSNAKHLKRNQVENRERISYFRFPSEEDIDLRNFWVAKCGRGDKFNPNTSRICEKHFSPNQFIRDFKNEVLKLGSKSVRKLVFGAIPDINLPRGTETLKLASLPKRIIHREQQNTIETIPYSNKENKSSKCKEEPSPKLQYNRITEPIPKLQNHRFTEPNSKLQNHSEIEFDSLFEPFVYLDNDSDSSASESENEEICIDSILSMNLINTDLPQREVSIVEDSNNEVLMLKQQIATLNTKSKRLNEANNKLIEENHQIAEEIEKLNKENSNLKIQSDCLRLENKAIYKLLKRA